MIKVKNIVVVFAVTMVLVSLTSCGKPSKYPINGKFVFKSTRAGNSWNMYLWEKNKIRMISKGGLAPQWSPDGKLIAYAVEDRFNETGKNAIILTDENGKIQKVLETSGVPGYFSWSPDGNKIYYEQIKKGTTLHSEGIYVMDIATQKYEKIWTLDHDSNIVNLQTSPTGNKILFEKDKPQDGLYLLDLNTLEIKYLTNGVNSAWFPDGKHIVFTTNIDENGNNINQDMLGYFFKLNIEDGKREKIRKEHHLMLLGLKVSRDGKYFYYTIQGRGQYIVVSPVDNENIEIAVTKPIMKKTGLSQDWTPDWFQGE